jgi:6-phosphogluconolactonase
MNDILTAYVGTYTNGDSKGIYRFALDITTGKIFDINLAAEIGNPTYLCISKNKKYLYTVEKREKLGGVASYLINSSNGSLELINHQLDEGSSPCHVSLDINDSYLFSANYHKGEALVFPINKDGSLNPPSSNVKHEGSGPNKERQEKAHAHYVSLTPDEKHVCVVDLGIDKVVSYDFDRGNLSKSDKLTLALKSGSGPRHMAFHPNNKFAYVLTELSSEVVALEYNLEKGSFSVIEYVTSLPEEFTDDSYASAIHISPDGKFLYASNRGHDSIAVFRINNDSGKLSLIEHVSTQGSGPRDFCIDPTGKYLIVANQNTSNLVPFSIDKETGRLTQANVSVTIPNAVCIKFL